jgi:sugar-specific transcriptional regulator TrmB
MSKYLLLKSLGFSKNMVACYASLHSSGAATALELADRIHISQTSIYRPLRKLEARGFITSLKTPPHPRYYYSVKLVKALDYFADYQRALLKPLLKVEKEQKQRVKNI